MLSQARSLDFSDKFYVQAEIFKGRLCATKNTIKIKILENKNTMENFRTFRITYYFKNVKYLNFVMVLGVTQNCP